MKRKNKMQESMGEISDTSRVQRLEALIADKKFNPFGTMDASKFQRELEEMSIADMQRIAMDIGVRPASNRIALKKQLIGHFNSFRRENLNILPEAPVISQGETNSKLLKLISQGL